MTRSRKSVATGRQFAVCIDNDECEASLDVPAAVKASLLTAS
jgi:hypothetical protein